MARRPTLLLLLLSSSLVFVRCAQEQELAEVMQLLKQSLKSVTAPFIDLESCFSPKTLQKNQ